VPRGRFDGLFVVVVLCSALLPTAASAGRAGQDFVVPSIEYDAFVLVNQQRAANGAAPLRLNRQLTQAAEAYAVDLARGNYLSHTGRDGKDMADRIEASGYPLLYWAGETLVGGQTTAAGAINAFMLSTPHRAILLDAKFTDVGLGYAPEAVTGGGSRWVIDFASSVATVTPEPYTTPVPGATATPIPTATPVPLPTASAHRSYLPSVAR
jgi:uncharacterized protein YkwD